MKRWSLVLVLFLILIFSFSFVSAGFFSDLWKKITGKAVIDNSNYGSVILNSNFVLNSGNVLSSDYDYSVLQYATNITCPYGVQAYISYPTLFCQHVASGQVIGGWEVISFNSVVGATGIKTIASDLNLGCSSCGYSTSYRVFYTSGDYNSGTNWTYAGSCTISDNADQAVCDLTLSGDIKNLLLSRDAGGDFRPDPAIHSISVISPTITSNQTSNQTNQTTCNDECSLNQVSCSGNYSRSCGNYDSDSCFEWNSGNYCNYGCFNGICNTNQTPSNQTNATSINFDPKSASTNELITAIKDYNSILKYSPTMQDVINRKNIMIALAEKNPREFLNNVISQQTLLGLPFNLQTEVEQIFSVQNERINVYHQDYFDESKSKFLYETAKDGNKLFLTEELSIISGTTLNINGYKLGNVIVSDKAYVKNVPFPFTKERLTPLKVRVILIRYQDAPAPPFSSEQAYSYFFNGTTQAFYKESSFGKTRLDGSVSNWYTIPKNSADESGNCLIPWIDDILEWEKDNLANYDAFYFLVESRCKYSWGGMGGTGITFVIEGIEYNFSMGWTNLVWDFNADAYESYLFSVNAHELGHMLGAGHANAIDCDIGVIIDNNCVNSEYGDRFDIMGTGTYAKHFNSYFKDIFGWIQKNDSINIKGPGSYTLTPLEKPGAKIAKISTFRIVNGEKINGTYYLEYRQPYGFDRFERLSNPIDPLEIDPNLNMNGIFIHWVQDTETYIPKKPWTIVLDFSPTQGKMDGNFTLEKYYDSNFVALISPNTFRLNNGMEISIISSDPSNITFSVTEPAPLCGDGVIGRGEDCDDGNTNNRDGCSNICKREKCIQFFRFKFCF